MYASHSTPGVTALAFTKRSSIDFLLVLSRGYCLYLPVLCKFKGHTSHARVAGTASISGNGCHLLLYLRFSVRESFNLISTGRGHLAFKIMSFTVATNLTSQPMYTVCFLCYCLPKTLNTDFCGRQILILPHEVIQEMCSR